MGPKRQAAGGTSTRATRGRGTPPPPPPPPPQVAPDHPWTALGIQLDNPVHQQRFRTHSAQIIRPTRFPHHATIRRLGLQGIMTNLTNNMGFEDYFNKPPHYTSRRLTLEFLSTLEKEEVFDPESGVCYDQVKFQLMNQHFERDLTDINEIMGWDEDAPIQDEIARNAPTVRDTSDFNIVAFWAILTGEDWDAARSKASHIIHPAVRLMHRFLVYHVWGRTELGAVSAAEMKALWLATTPRNTDFLVPINYAEKYIGKWIASQKLKTPGTEIVMGGTITRLALALVPHFNENQVDHVGDSSDRYLGMEALVAAQFLRKYEGDDGEYLDNRWIWLVRGFPWCNLPNPTASLRISRNNNANIWWIEREFAPAPEEAGIVRHRCGHQQRPRGRPPSTSTAAASSSTSPQGTMNFAALQTQLSAIQSQLEANSRESEHQRVLLQGIYSAGVQAGSISPYLNYPMYPPQEGPLPGWFQGAPTHPYYPPRAEGIDYRFPGGV